MWIYVGWFTSDHIDVAESDGNVVFSIPSNNQTITLEGISLSELSEANFTIKDGSAAQEILALVGQESSSTGGGGDAPPNEVPDDTPSVPTAGNGTIETVHVTWNWGAHEVISDFSPSEDVIDFGSLSSKGVSISESDGDLHIEVVGNGGHSYVIENVQAEDLTAENLSAPTWNDDVLHGSNGVVAQLAALGYDDIV